MTWPARYSQVAAWLIVLALVGAMTLGIVQGLPMLEPAAPGRLDHMHGVIVSIKGNDTFAVRESGHASLVWFRIARGAPISLAHLRRHLAEHAQTDVFYQDQRQGTPLAWLAD
jgi:hypothetical protein